MPPTRAKHAATVGDLRQLPIGPQPEIAFTGRSNVGKSSLINSLLRQPGLARTSRTPGKTRQIVFFAVDNLFHLVDLPGYGYARAPEALRADWQGLIEPYLAERDQLAGLVALVDARNGPTELDLVMFEWLTSADLPFVIVMTKCDKLSNNQLASKRRQTEKAVDSFGYDDILTTSSKSGRGLSHVWEWMHRLTGDHEVEVAQPPPFKRGKIK
ncbi:MAG: ribosome biogenesis GTP-binding protein YihA/YsxC [Candidatus Latescibacteria bacterium]|jgi:GTP-binding protein|nr:ribosome biogenesis GTP-binding protein YihA/YsxC [Candidatus Latescibacterota bacterium]